jgi:threonyl-tRNA synthetase
LDDRNETLKYRIREAQLDKIPYMLVVGEKEKTDGTVAVRARKEEDGGVMKVEDFMAKALMEIATKKR